MQGCFLALVGLFFGAVLGAALGFGIGLAYTKLFHVSDFEGYSGMLVFYTFLPIGAIVGGLGGAMLLGLAGTKKYAWDTNAGLCVGRGLINVPNNAFDAPLNVRF